jgi:hypothetical protein
VSHWPSESELRAVCEMACGMEAAEAKADGRPRPQNKITRVALAKAMRVLSRQQAIDKRLVVNAGCWNRGALLCVGFQDPSGKRPSAPCAAPAAS